VVRRVVVKHVATDSERMVAEVGPCGAEGQQVSVELEGPAAVSNIALVRRWAIAGTPLFLTDERDDCALYGPTRAVSGLHALQSLRAIPPVPEGRRPVMVAPIARVSFDVSPDRRARL
jgi:hypothetical protein